MDTIVKIWINECIVQGEKCFIAKNFSIFQDNANALCIFFADVHDMVRPTWLIFNNYSQKFSFVHPWNCLVKFYWIPVISWVCDLWSGFRAFVDKVSIQLSFSVVGDLIMELARAGDPYQGWLPFVNTQ